jgi:hypothetical protein
MKLCDALEEDTAFIFRVEKARRVASYLPA